MPLCVAYGCDTLEVDKNADPPITLHTFPSDPELRKKWIQAVRRKSWTPSKSSRLCSKHFNANDFDRSPFYTKINKGVVPSIFADNPEHLEPKKTKARKAIKRRGSPVKNNHCKTQLTTKLGETDAALQEFEATLDVEDTLSDHLEQPQVVEESFDPAHMEQVYLERMVQTRGPLDDDHIGKRFSRVSLASAIQHMVDTRAGTIPKDSWYLSLVRRYELARVAGSQVLVKKRKNPEDPLVIVLPFEDYFGVLWEYHLATDHGGKDRLISCLENKYWIPRVPIEVFLTLCGICKARKSYPRRKHPVRTYQKHLAGSQPGSPQAFEEDDHWSESRQPSNFEEESSCFIGKLETEVMVEIKSEPQSPQTNDTPLIAAGLIGGDDTVCGHGEHLKEESSNGLLRSLLLSGSSKELEETVNVKEEPSNWTDELERLESEQRVLARALIASVLKRGARGHLTPDTRLCNGGCTNGLSSLDPLNGGEPLKTEL